MYAISSISGCNIRVHMGCLDQAVNYDGDSRKGSAGSSGSSSSSSGETTSSVTFAVARLFRRTSINYSNNSYLLQFCPGNHAIEHMKKIDHFNLIKVLGKGGFGKVVLAEQKTTQKMCAVKILKKSALRESVLSYIQTEKRILALSSQHPFLIGMYSCFQSEVGDAQTITLNYSFH